MLDKTVEYLNINSQNIHHGIADLHIGYEYCGAKRQRVRIIDISDGERYASFLYKCLAPIPFRRYRSREEYLERAAVKGFHKKLLIFDGDIVGQIEYAPARFSGYPISDDNIVVMNCIWVLRKAKGHGLGRMLVEDMVRSEGNTANFATIALENHWSPWFKKSHMEKLGFKPVDKIKVKHKTKHREQVFSIWLMWMPIREKTKQPAWNREKLLEGVTFCLAHPLYCPQTWKGNILEMK
jgi:GNAT superfamily N-acetyltransferase